MEHAIRAAFDVSGDEQVYVFASQAILGQYAEAPESLLQSTEADAGHAYGPVSGDRVAFQLKSRLPNFGLLACFVPTRSENAVEGHPASPLTARVNDLPRLL